MARLGDYIRSRSDAAMWSHEGHLDHRPALSVPIADVQEEGDGQLTHGGGTKYVVAIKFAMEEV
jgi:hypothetical protein